MISTLILWSPFLFRFDAWMGLKIDKPGFDNIYKQYDGPLYVIAAKSLYDPAKIDIPGKGLVISLPLSSGYFAAHLPFYPVLIRVFREIGVIGGLLGEGGYLKSMISVNLLSTIILACFFFFFVKNLKLAKNPLLLTSVFLFIPRFLVVRSAGAPESLFLLFILISIFFFEKDKLFLSGLLGGLAAMTKSPGVLLFFAYALVFLERYVKTRKIEKTWFWILLIPLGLLAVFGLYQIRFGDFLAYFHSGDNIHLVAPYAAFNYQNRWVGTAWLEDIIFYFFVYLCTVFRLRDSKQRSLFYFSLVFLIPTLFVQHRDIARYSLPLLPMAAVAFERFLTAKKLLIVFILILPAIYLYAWGLFLYNAMPISDWTPFL